MPENKPHRLWALQERIPLRYKLYSIAALFVVMLASLAIFNYFQIRTIQTVHIPARVAVRLIDEALLNMAIYERELINEVNSPYNSTFYLKRQSENYTKWQENYTVFNQNLKKVNELYQGTDVASELATIQPKITAYRDKFIALMNAHQERGFKDFGREGAMRARAHALEEQITNPNSEVLLLQLRRAEKDFFLRKEPPYVTAFEQLAAELATQLTAADQKVLLEEYRTLFNEIVALDEKIGLSPSSGLRGEMRVIIFEASDVVTSAQQQVLIETDQAIEQINQTNTIISTIFIILSLLFAVVITRSITSRVQRLMIATQKLTKGDLSYRIPPSGQDEIGILAGKFNTMAESIHRNQETIREHEQELAQNVRKFELAATAVHEAIYDWDMASDILAWGKGLARHFGYTNRTETSIEWWTGRIHPEDTHAIADSLDSMIKRKQHSWEANYRFQRANGTYADVTDRGFIEYDKKGVPVRMVGSLMDMTRQRELERAKDEFISVASHQLRTPLGSMRWNLELLLEQHDLKRETRETIKLAFDATLRMLNLVGGLLNVARIEQGRVQALPTATDIVEVLHAAIGEMEPIARRTHVTIDDSNLRNKSIPTMIDANRFREAIQNLLSNAVKYTPAKGKVKISVKPDTRHVTIVIADNGMGIPEEEQAKMFSKFFRASNATRTQTEGTGLGLFVVQSYVEGWGGRIWFKSKVNHGTTFYVTVPLRKRAARKKHDEATS